MIIMKQLLLFLPLLIVGCDMAGNNVADVENSYLNVDCVIIKKIVNKPDGSGSTKAFLIRLVDDTTMYSEFTAINSYRMSDSVWYNHSVGDTLHFEYIEKYRFFKSKLSKEQIIKDLGDY